MRIYSHRMGSYVADLTEIGLNNNILDTVVELKWHSLFWAHNDCNLC